MNRTLTRSVIIAAAACLGFAAPNLFAQAAPTSPGGAGAEEAVKLDPFSVQADSDVGFVAASSLAGGRIATALKDTPVAFSVITREFLDAFNVTDVAEAANFSVNTATMPDDNSADGFGRGASSRIRVRGVAANTPTRNFFPYANTADNFSTERIDFARGSNSILFGSGGNGGTINTNTKQALIARPLRELSVQVGTWNRYRLTADVNQPLNDKIAVRANLMWDSRESWRDREWEERKGVHLAATWEITKNLKFRVETEYRDTKRATANTQLKDRLSGWNGSASYFKADPTVTAAQLRVAGAARNTTPRFTAHPDYNGIAYNFQNTFQTIGAGYNATNPSFLNGKQIRTVNFSLNNQGMVDVWDTKGGDRYALAIAGAPGFEVPLRHQTTLLYPPDERVPTFSEIARDYAAYLTYTPLPGLFLELAGDVNNSPVYGDNSGRGGRQETFIDIMRLLPDGVTPNPGYLRRYSDYLIRDSIRGADYKNGRFHAAYVRDTRFGKLQFGLMAGRQENVSQARQRQRLIPLTQFGPDFRAWVVRADQSPYGLYTRVYHDSQEKFNRFPAIMSGVRAVDPVTGVNLDLKPTMAFNTVRETTNSDTSRNNNFGQIAANFDLFKNKLILIGALRRDTTEFQQTLFFLPGRMPAGWNGLDLFPKPTATADYWDLKYLPKDATGKVIGPETPAIFRPTVLQSNNVEVGQAQYANDRFRDDTNPPMDKQAANTRTYGFVYNVKPWLGIYANDSTTFDIRAPAQGPEGEQYSSTTAQSYDAGVRVTLPGGRLSMSAGWFSAYQEGVGLNIGDGWSGAHNAIAAAPVVGDLSPSGRNVRGVRTWTIDVASTTTSETKGYEFEVTANLTRNWRLILNAGETQAVEKDTYPNMPGYFKRIDPLLRQALTDAGVIIDPGDNAIINPALNDPTKINVDKVQAAVDGWNAMSDTVIPTILGRNKEVRKAGGSLKLSGNLATDYRFSSGKLNGLRVGLAVNYRGPQVIGTRVSDTIVDPANPLRAIDDPTVGPDSYIYSENYFKTTATLAYTLRLKETRRYLPKSIQFNLTIDNLFDYNKAMYGYAPSNVNTTDSIFLAPRNNDISQSSRVTIPGNVSYMMPRNFMLSARMSF